MENIPFSSESNDEDDSTDHESVDDSKETSEEKKSKRKSIFESGSILFGKESGDTSSKEDSNKKASLFGAGEDRETLFSGLFKSDNEEAQDTESGAETDLSPEDEDFIGVSEESPDNVTEEFQELVNDKIDSVESSVDGSVEELAADASFLSSVESNVEGGLPPSEAISEAAEAPPVIDNFESIPPVPSSYTEAYAPPPLEAPEDIDPNDDLPGVGFSSSASLPTVASSNPNLDSIPTSLTPVSEIPGAPESIKPSTRVDSEPGIVTSPAHELTPDSPGVSKMNRLYYRDGRRGGLLMGGTLGYLFGRRGGRIRAEERLQPEINKKDSTIDQLKSDLERSEEEARKSAVEQASRHLEEITVESLAQERKEQHEREESFAATLVEEHPTTLRVESNKQELDEQMQSLAPERTRDVKSDLNPTQKIEEKKKNERDARSMNMHELLEVADNITLDSVSLRELYDNRRINSRNLRRVVTEYMTGRHYDRLLRRSLEHVELNSSSQDEARRPTDNTVNSTGRVHTSGPTRVTKGVSNSTGVPQPIASSIVSSVGPVLEEKSLEDNSFQVTNSTAIAFGMIIGVILVAIIFYFSSGA